MSSPLTPVEQLERDVAEEEASVQADFDKALVQWREVAARLKALQAQVAQAAGLGLNVDELRAKVDALKLPQLQPGTAMQRSDALRREAVAGRRSALLELKTRIPAFLSDTSRLMLRVSAEEGAVAKQVELSKAVAAQVAEAARRLEENIAPIARIRTVKREQQRVRMQVKIDFGSENNFYSGFSMDISNGGVFIATIKLVPIGTPMDVYFRLPTGEGIEAHGVVRWVRDLDDSRPEMMPGLGVQFVNLSAEARAAVEAFVKNRDPMFYPD